MAKIDGSKLKALREALDWSRQVLAEKMKVSPNSIGNWENSGKLSDANLRRLLEVLGAKQGDLEWDPSEAATVPGAEARRKELKDLAKHLKNQITLLTNDDHRFRQLIALWRLSAIASQVASLRDGTSPLNAIERTALLQSNLSAILDRLAAGDRFRTITDLSFWERERYGTAEFINANASALARQVCIQHLIQITPDQVSGDWSLVVERLRGLEDACRGGEGASGLAYLVGVNDLGGPIALVSHEEEQDVLLIKPREHMLELTFCSVTEDAFRIPNGLYNNHHDQAESSSKLPDAS